MGVGTQESWCHHLTEHELSHSRLHAWNACGCFLLQRQPGRQRSPEVISGAVILPALCSAPVLGGSCAHTSLRGMTATAWPWPVAPHHHQPWGYDKALLPWNNSDITQERAESKRAGAKVLTSLACWWAKHWIPHPESLTEGELGARMTSTNLPALQEWTQWWMLPWPWPSESEDRLLEWPPPWLCVRMLTELGVVVEGHQAGGPRDLACEQKAGGSASFLSWAMT